ncbi:hypothetical protein J437_LFUL013879, partial [Ladona fulva]
MTITATRLRKGMHGKLSLGNFNELNFNELPEAEKKVIGNSYQRKWKSLRDSYTRERAKQRNEIKSGSAKKYRKKYIFFEQLNFLETNAKPTEDSIEITDLEENIEGSLEATQEKSNEVMRTRRNAKRRHPDD